GTPARSARSKVDLRALPRRSAALRALASVVLGGDPIEREDARIRSAEMPQALAELAVAVFLDLALEDVRHVERRVVIPLAVEQPDDVSGFLNRARIPKVRHARALVLAT